MPGKLEGFNFFFLNYESYVDILYLNWQKFLIEMMAETDSTAGLVCNIAHIQNPIEEFEIKTEHPKKLIQNSYSTQHQK